MASSSVIAITASIAAKAYYEGTFIALPMLSPYQHDGPRVTYIPIYISRTQVFTNTAVHAGTVRTTESVPQSLHYRVRPPMDGQAVSRAGSELS